MSETMPDTVKVFDTWVTGKNGRLHFDVMTTNEATALKLAKQYLEGIGESGVAVTTRNASSVTANRSSSFRRINSGSSKKTAALSSPCLPDSIFRMD